MRRDEAVDRLHREEFDLLVVGGGITGVGVALDAVTRGLRVALVEKRDYAAGTSSRSSKLIHGGLRYLAHLEVALVREALKERGVLQEMAPFLVSPIPFVMPRYGKRRLLAVRAGLELYDVLALGSRFPRHRRLDADDVRRMAPALREDVAGGLLYWDARTDDTRLTWAVARTALEHGAVLANHAEVRALARSGPRILGRPQAGRVHGASVADRLSGEEFDVRARVVVNATGVWSDDIRRMEDPDDEVGIRPSKGIHILFEADRLPVRTALAIPTPDGRYVFVIPWEDDRVLVGTTDEDHEGSLDEPRVRRAEIDYLVGVLNHVLTDPVSHEDIVGSFAGLRPLIQKPGERSKDLSRRHKVLLGPGGVVTITGGKLTTWRPMAADAVDAVLEAGDFRARPPSRTAELKLAGGDEPPGLQEALAAAVAHAGLDPRQAQRLYGRYGSRAGEVLALVEADPHLGLPLHPDAAYLRAEAAHAISAEHAMTPEDVLARRLRLQITTRDRGLAALPWVCDRLASEHGWTPERRTEAEQTYRSAVQESVAAERN